MCLWAFIEVKKRRNGCKMANGDRRLRFYNPFVPFSSTVSHTSPHLAKYHYIIDNEDLLFYSCSIPWITWARRLFVCGLMVPMWYSIVLWYISYIYTTVPYATKMCLAIELSSYKSCMSISLHDFTCSFVRNII